MTNAIKIQSGSFSILICNYIDVHDLINPMIGKPVPFAVGTQPLILPICNLILKNESVNFKRL
jgi:hypothetical protein